MLLAFPAQAAAATGYAYSGVASPAPVRGLAATVTALKPPDVRSGHVAVWVGIGAPNGGPGGEGEWLQVGIGAFAGGRPLLYVEVKRGGRFNFRVIRQRLRSGVPHRVALSERGGGRWQVSVDGRPLSWQARLDSAVAGEAVVTAETWTLTDSCNSFSFRASDVAVHDGRGWHPLRRPRRLVLPPLSLSHERGGYTLAERCS